MQKRIAVAAERASAYGRNFICGATVGSAASRTGAPRPRSRKATAPLSTVSANRISPALPASRPTQTQSDASRLSILSSTVSQTSPSAATVASPSRTDAGTHSRRFSSRRDSVPPSTVRRSRGKTASGATSFSARASSPRRTPKTLQTGSGGYPNPSACSAATTFAPRRSFPCAMRSPLPFLTKSPS